ncbi:MAG TPA: cysteine--tRNA ligase [Bacilli bacterium]
MTLKIYNTLTRTKEIFQPMVPGKVSMYVCGPTVYNYIHIGNARPLIFFDVARRYLRMIGYDVKYVVNFTDVDDKLIRKAAEMNSSVLEVADTFIRAYYEDAEGLGIEAATIHPRVTENLPEIIEFIVGLIHKGYAYTSEGNVYFHTDRYPGYGSLSQQNIDELQLGIRVDVDERKANVRDFVLWKSAKPDEICWTSPWGEGRPGWHIECSAMAKKYLGETIDIHGGGHDLVFPHHECEAAQSEALSGRPLAKYWMHNGYIHINNEKMAKSAGNGINVNTLLKNTRSVLLRFFILSTHYRNPLNFSDEALNQAENSLGRIENCLASLKHRISSSSEEGVIDPSVITHSSAIVKQFHFKMEDDFNTPDAITAIFDLVSETNQYLQKAEANLSTLTYILRIFQDMNAILGIIEEQKEDLLDDQIEKLIAERIESRSAKNWARADEIRDILIAKGIVLEDTPQGIRWRRK